MLSWIFIIITAVFSVTWSSEIILIYWFAARELFLFIIKVENQGAASYFCGSVLHFIFQDSLINRKLKIIAEIFIIIIIIIINVESSQAGSYFCGKQNIYIKYMFFYDYLMNRLKKTALINKWKLQ